MSDWPTERNLDGIFFRVQIDGKWCNRCVTDMPWNEVEKILEDLPHSWAVDMAKHLHGCLRSIGDQFNIARDQSQ